VGRKERKRGPVSFGIKFQGTTSMFRFFRSAVLLVLCSLYCTLQKYTSSSEHNSAIASAKETVYSFAECRVVGRVRL